MYLQCAKATESLQHAVVHVLQSVGSQDQLIDPRSSFKCSLLDVGDAVIAQVAASGGKTERGGRCAEKRGKTGGMRRAAQQSGVLKPPPPQQQHLACLKRSVWTLSEILA